MRYTSRPLANVTLSNLLSARKDPPDAPVPLSLVIASLLQLFGSKAMPFSPAHGWPSPQNHGKTLELGGDFRVVSKFRPPHQHPSPTLWDGRRKPTVSTAPINDSAAQPRRAFRRGRERLLRNSQCLKVLKQTSRLNSMRAPGCQ